MQLHLAATRKPAFAVQKQRQRVRADSFARGGVGGVCWVWCEGEWLGGRHDAIGEVDLERCTRRWRRRWWLVRAAAASFPPCSLSATAWRFAGLVQHPASSTVDGRGCLGAACDAVKGTAGIYHVKDTLLHVYCMVITPSKTGIAGHHCGTGRVQFSGLVASCGCGAN